MLVLWRKLLTASNKLFNKKNKKKKEPKRIHIQHNIHLGRTSQNQFTKLINMYVCNHSKYIDYWKGYTAPRKLRIYFNYEGNIFQILVQICMTNGPVMFGHHKVNVKQTRSSCWPPAGKLVNCVATMPKATRVWLCWYFSKHT